MCSFCKDKYKIDTVIGDKFLQIRIDEEDNRLLLIRIEEGCIGATKPLLINFCPFCGEKLNS